MLDALPGERFPGRISRMVPTVDRAKATVMTKVRFDAIDPRVLPEMSAKVAFLSREASEADRRPVSAVPADAVVQRDGRGVVFVVKDGVATAVPVTTGAKLGEMIAIGDEVKSGEKVVVKPARTGDRRAGRVAASERGRRRGQVGRRTADGRSADKPDRRRPPASESDPVLVSIRHLSKVLPARRPGDPGAARHRPRRAPRATTSR